MLIIFGGILEVTHELNDMHAYDLSTGEWFIFYDESGIGAVMTSNSPVRGGFGGTLTLNQQSPEHSPSRLANTNNNMGKTQSGVKGMSTMTASAKDMGARAYSQTAFGNMFASPSRT
jgi:hypothetical protein